MKDQQLIKDLIHQGESTQLSFKASAYKEEIARVICGFLNAEGGTLLAGVNEEGIVTGVEGAEKLEKEIASYLISSIIPQAPVTVSTEKIDNQSILLVKVWHGSKPPYVFNGKIYIRKGGQTVLASPDDISGLITERQKTELHWERQPVLGARIEDLDELEIRNTLRDIEKSARGKAFGYTQVEEFLTYYGLYENGYVTQAALVLFGKEPARYLPQARVRLTVFTGSKADDTFSYDRILEGNLFRNIEEITQFFEVNIAVSSRFTDKSWQRIDSPYPKAALREGLMNALIHRDYTSVSGSVLVAFYPSGLEITNYGELPVELSPADLSRNHLSFPRNPDIAHICFLRGWIEKIGRGTLKIVEDCKTKGYPTPRWQSRGGTTTLVFPEVTVTAKAGEAASDAVNEGAIEGAIKGAIEGALEGVTKNVKDKLAYLLTIIAKDEGKRLPDYKALTGYTESSMERYIKQLRDARLIEFKGDAAHTGGYYLTSHTKKQLPE